MVGGTLLVNGAPCRLFHFSGYEPWSPGRVTRYSDRVSMGDLGAAAGVFARYGDLLREEGVESTRHLPYRYAEFDNGVPLPAIARAMHRALGDTAQRFGDPFATGSGSFFEWLGQPVDGARGRAPVVTRLWDAVYHSRPDLREAFPDHLGADRKRFLHWTRLEETDHDVPRALVS